MSTSKVRIDSPYINYKYWSKGQTHCHSTNSDNKKDSPEELLTAYKNKGYGFVCLTDHNQCSPDANIDGIIHIESGEDGKSDRHHILVLGVNRDVLLEYKRKNQDLDSDGIWDLPTVNCENIQPRIDYMVAQKAISVMAHPSASHAADKYGFTLNEMKKSTGYTGMEIFNADFEYPNWSVYSKYDTSDNMYSWWDEVLKYKKQKVWCFAGDDCHDAAGYAFNRGWIMVNTSFNVMDKINNKVNSKVKAFEDDLIKLWNYRGYEYKANALDAFYNQSKDAYRLKFQAQKELIDNIKAGNFYTVVRCPKGNKEVSLGTGDSGPQMNIYLKDNNIIVNTDLPDSEVRFIIGNALSTTGKQKIPKIITSHGNTMYPCKGDEGYVRIEVEQKRPAPNGEKETYIAFSQPLFVSCEE